MILDKIVEDKKEYLKRAKEHRSLHDIESMADEVRQRGRFERRSLIGSLREAIQQKRVPIIAEIKRRSPSGGQMKCTYDPIELAQIYEKNGAAAISVLTDEKYFGGSVEDLIKVREAVAIPVLRKDFIIDKYQVYEAKAFGADIILLIAAILDDSKIACLLELAHELELEVLIESHTRDELMRSIASDAVLLGVNNRNLDSLVTDLATSEELLPPIPDDRISITESGVVSNTDVKRLLKAGAKAFLIGESLLKSENPGNKLAEMVCIDNSE